MRKFFPVPSVASPITRNGAGTAVGKYIMVVLYTQFTIAVVMHPNQLVELLLISLPVPCIVELDSMKASATYPMLQWI